MTRCSTAHAKAVCKQLPRSCIASSTSAGKYTVESSKLSSIGKIRTSTSNECEMRPNRPLPSRPRSTSKSAPVPTVAYYVIAMITAGAPTVHGASRQNDSPPSRAISSRNVREEGVSISNSLPRQRHDPHVYCI